MTLENNGPFHHFGEFGEAAANRLAELPELLQGAKEDIHELGPARRRFFEDSLDDLHEGLDPFFTGVRALFSLRRPSLLNAKRSQFEARK